MTTAQIECLSYTSTRMKSLQVLPFTSKHPRGTLDPYLLFFLAVEKRVRQFTIHGGQETQLSAEDNYAALKKIQKSQQQQRKQSRSKDVSYLCDLNVAQIASDAFLMYTSSISTLLPLCQALEGSWYCSHARKITTIVESDNLACETDKLIRGVGVAEQKINSKQTKRREHRGAIHGQSYPYATVRSRKTLSHK